MTATVVTHRNRASASAVRSKKILRRIGADLSSSAGADTSAIAFAGLSELAEPLLGLVNELAREAAFPEPEFERERRQKLEEVKLDRTQPGFLASERLRKVLFGAHPYAQVSPRPKSKSPPTSATISCRSTANSTRRKTRCWCMVGDFDYRGDAEDHRKSLWRWAGKKPAATRHPLRRRIRKDRRVYLVHVPGAVQTQILAGCHAITRKHAGLGQARTRPTASTAALSIRGW